MCRSEDCVSEGCTATRRYIFITTAPPPPSSCSRAGSVCRQTPSLNNSSESFQNYAVIYSSLLLPTSVCPGNSVGGRPANKNPMPTDAELTMQENCGRSRGRATHTGQIVTCRPPAAASTARWVTSHFIPRLHRLSGSAGFSLRSLIPPVFLLFRVPLANPFIHNGMCVVVVVQPETRHVLNKQKLV